MATACSMWLRRTKKVCDTSNKSGDSSRFEDPLCRGENGVKHWLRELARECVLLAGVVRSEEPAGTGQWRFSAVAEFWKPAGVPLPTTRFSERGTPGNLPEGDDHSRLCEVDRLDQPLPAVGDFFGQRLIVGRSTVTNGGDRTID